MLCFGAVIRGDTGHYDFVAGECASGIQQVQLATGVPVIFGVLTTDTLDQALERSEPDETNKGREAALTGIEMVRLLRTGSRSPERRAAGAFIGRSQRSTLADTSGRYGAPCAGSGPARDDRHGRTTTMGRRQ